MNWLGLTIDELPMITIDDRNNFMWVMSNKRKFMLENSLIIFYWLYALKGFGTMHTLCLGLESWFCIS